jgi:hypothetical protein
MTTGLLGTRYSWFSNILLGAPEDEGVPVEHLLTSSIDTSEIDAYRQGVELRLPKHYEQGVVKIHSGETDHVLKQQWFGMGDKWWKDAFFTDKQEFRTILFASSSTYEFPTTLAFDENLEVGTAHDGVIEPFEIRDVVESSTSSSLFHVANAAVMAGNVDINDASDAIVTVYDPAQRDHKEFFDVRGELERQSTYDDARSDVEPFNDRRLTSNFTLSSSVDVGMIAALSPMTGSTMNYIAPWQVSSTCGWSFDYNSSIGTDSLAFGGMTY